MYNRLEFVALTGNQICASRRIEFGNIRPVHEHKW